MRDLEHYAIILAWVVVSGVASAQSPGQTNATQSAVTGIYDLNPDHLWNRLHRIIYVRVASNGTEYGENRLDPLLWSNTKHLRGGASFEQLIQMLDELMASGREKLPQSLLKRALLQRDLWAAFDWVNHSPWRDPNNDAQVRRMALSIRLARAIKLLSLSAGELRSLPDNYAEAVAFKAFGSVYNVQHPEVPFLPSDLFQTNGNWVGLRSVSNSVLTPRHVADFGGRSVFLVFLSVPGGRQETLDYLKGLREFPQPWVVRDDPNFHTRSIVPNPDLPQLPVGTQVALVRQMMLIDDKGEIFPSKLTESVQLRVFREIRDAKDREQRPPQDVYEFQLTYQKLLAGQRGGLRAIEPQERDFAFVQFMSHGIDPFEAEYTNPPLTNAAERVQYIESGRSVVLQTCFTCHSASGIRSLASFTRGFTGGPIPAAFVQSEPESSFVSEATQTKVWKMQRREWGFLQGLWLNQSP
jgi:hypothetical protein